MLHKFFVYPNISSFLDCNCFMFLVYGKTESISEKFWVPVVLNVQNTVRAGQSIFYHRLSCKERLQVFLCVQIILLCYDCYSCQTNDTRTVWISCAHQGVYTIPLSIVNCHKLRFLDSISISASMLFRSKVW